MENKTKTGQASTVDKIIAQLVNDVHKDLAVTDTDTGKLLSYRQLMRNPKYKKNWSISSANEFGRLENGVGGRIKNPTKTITFITRNEIKYNRRKDVTYRKVSCSIQQEKKENIP